MILAQTTDALRVHVIVGHYGRGADAGTWLVCCALERSHAVAIRDALQAEADEFHAWASASQPMRDSSGYTQVRPPEYGEIQNEITRRLAAGPLPLLTDAGFRYDEVGSWYEVCAVGEDPAVAAEHIAGQPERWQTIAPARARPDSMRDNAFEVALMCRDAEATYPGYARQRVELDALGEARIEFPACGPGTPVQTATGFRAVSLDMRRVVQGDLTPAITLTSGITVQLRLEIERQEMIQR